jgi:sporulation protein YlmC with PRC-barrel domain
MNISLKKIIGKEIFNNKNFFGRVRKVFIDNSNGRIVGILNNKKSFLIRDDFLYKNNKLCIKNVQNVQKIGQNWLNMHVFNQNKQKIGTVYDILFDENFLYVNQIVVCKSLFFFRFSLNNFL